MPEKRDSPLTWAWRQHCHPHKADASGHRCTTAVRRAACGHSPSRDLPIESRKRGRRHSGGHWRSNNSNAGDLDGSVSQAVKNLPKTRINKGHLSASHAICLLNVSILDSMPYEILLPNLSKCLHLAVSLPPRRQRWVMIRKTVKEALHIPIGSRNMVSANSGQI